LASLYFGVPFIGREFKPYRAHVVTVVGVAKMNDEKTGVIQTAGNFVNEEER